MELLEVTYKDFNTHIAKFDVEGKEVDVEFVHEGSEIYFEEHDLDEDEMIELLEQHLQSRFNF